MTHQETKLPEPVAWLGSNSVIVEGLWETETTISLYDDGGQPLYTVDTVRRLVQEAEQRMKQRCIDAATDAIAFNSGTVQMEAHIRQAIKELV